jgi:hypothetical protein
VLLSGKPLDIDDRRAAMSGHDVAVGGAIGLSVVSGLAGCFGLLRWWRAQPSRAFWIAIRVSQALAIAYALAAGVLYLAGQRPASSLFYLYALLPIPVGFVAEQLRIVAADQVLGARDLDDAQAVGRLPSGEQREIVLAILRREMVVMALAAVVICFLALRAAGTF